MTTITFPSKIEIPVNFTLNVEFTENELLIKNNYNNLLYTTKEKLPFEIINQIMNSKNSIFLKDITEKVNPILIVKSNDLSSEIINTQQFSLRQIASKEQLTNKLEELKKYYNLDQTDFNKIRRDIIERIICLRNKSQKLIEQRMKENSDLESKFNQDKRKITEDFKVCKELFNEIKKEKNIKLDDESKKILVETLKDQQIATTKLAHEILREKTEIDIKYEDFPGEEYVCRGLINGCTNRTIYGNNPYTTDSNYCSAARHYGLIDETGGIFHVKKIGSLSYYPGGVQNGVSSTQWTSAWDALSFHKTYLDCHDDKFDYCGKYKD